MVTVTHAATITSNNGYFPLALERLTSILRTLDRAAVAVSGGVDSLTLARIARDVLGPKAAMYHAVSPAVPEEATERVRILGQQYGWRIELINAGEFESADYMRNPVNRCYFCKTHLYDAIDAIAKQTHAQILSGTNTDDLGEYRPGLEAAKQHSVRHPFVEANIGKADVRALARQLGMDAIAELPAAPCLSSRMETGIAIDADTLKAIHTTEKLVAAALQPKTVRCRVRANGVVIELDETTLAVLDEKIRNGLISQIKNIFVSVDSVKSIRFEAYRTGSAFLIGSNYLQKANT
jgi:pyridinium-3,5-biscarboxylic acid mononucleotide sulfurtransferase